MRSFINTLSDTILGKDQGNHSLDELKALSEKYPFASAFQLLYTQKLAAGKKELYHPQLQKTLLYYNNPLFINYLVNTTTKEKDRQPAEISMQVITAESSSGSSEEEELLPVEAEKPQTDEQDALPPLPEFKIEAIDPASARLSFTPYHTVDYFAAQGIKFSEEQNDGDRFGTQLKSFTSWLKQMKRLPGASKGSAMSAFEEKNIEQMAATSVKGENAITEAMAEVWEKQGDTQKAINIYKKLSLQIPAKSAYFAAKIDHLKK